MQFELKPGYRYQRVIVRGSITEWQHNIFIAYLCWEDIISQVAGNPRNDTPANTQSIDVLCYHSVALNVSSDGECRFET